MIHKRSQRLFTLLITLLFISEAISYPKGIYSDQIYRAYIQGNIAEWKSIIQRMEQKTLNTVDAKLELVNYYYGYIGYLIGLEDHETAEKYIYKAEQLISEVLKLSPGNSSAYAYLGSMDGFRIEIDSYKTVLLGPRCLENIKKSVALDSRNPLAYLERGNASFHTPAIFGGSKEEAIQYYLKTISLFEEMNLNDENWLYFRALTLLAQAYEQTGQMQKAEKVYQKILRKEPDFAWVKNELYPDFLKKL
jgi:tetratricopeptide (TPR) repeat protein